MQIIQYDNHSVIRGVYKMIKKIEPPGGCLGKLKLCVCVFG